eukprot:TRINITY_DN62011_c0_g1_i1.p1 TRINITY_DN62011_c0_g1~~TRINITY_DN62011_c0_g1_i1.p1  ORF type:complete len:746 (+),score=58.35 TRINITY_DN62011_c0_g1_i1:125-2362(+)
MDDPGPPSSSPKLGVSTNTLASSLNSLGSPVSSPTRQRATDVWGPTDPRPELLKNDCSPYEDAPYFIVEGLPVRSPDGHRVGTANGESREIFPTAPFARNGKPPISRLWVPAGGQTFNVNASAGARMPSTLPLDQRPHYTNHEPEPTYTEAPPREHFAVPWRPNSRYASTPPLRDMPATVDSRGSSPLQTRRTPPPGGPGRRRNSAERRKQIQQRNQRNRQRPTTDRRSQSPPQTQSGWMQRTKYSGIDYRERERERERDRRGRERTQKSNLTNNVNTSTATHNTTTNMTNRRGSPSPPRGRSRSPSPTGSQQQQHPPSGPRGRERSNSGGRQQHVTPATLQRKQSMMEKTLSAPLERGSPSRKPKNKGDRDEPATSSWLAQNYNWNTPHMNSIATTGDTVPSAYIMLQLFVSFSNFPNQAVLLKVHNLMTVNDVIQLGFNKYLQDEALCKGRRPRDIYPKHYRLRVAQADGSVHPSYHILYNDKPVFLQLPEFPFMLTLTTAPKPKLDPVLRERIVESRRIKEQIERVAEERAAKRKQFQKLVGRTITENRVRKESRTLSIIADAEAAAGGRKRSVVPADAKGTAMIAHSFLSKLMGTVNQAADSSLGGAPSEKLRAGSIGILQEMEEARQKAEHDARVGEEPPSAIPKYKKGEKVDLRKNIDAIYKYYYGEDQFDQQRKWIKGWPCYSKCVPHPLRPCFGEPGWGDEDNLPGPAPEGSAAAATEAASMLAAAAPLPVPTLTAG